MYKEVSTPAVDLLSRHVMGVAHEDGLSRGSGEDEVLELIGQLRAQVQSLPADRFPNFVALADEVTGGDENTRFEFGLEVLLRGLQRALTRYCTTIRKMVTTTSTASSALT